MATHTHHRPVTPKLGDINLLLPVTLMFTIEDHPGSLESVLRTFNTHDICLHHIESRPSRSGTWVYDFMAEFEVKSPEHLQSFMKDVKSVTTKVDVVSSDPQIRKSHKGNQLMYNIHFSECRSMVPQKAC